VADRVTYEDDPGSGLLVCRGPDGCGATLSPEDTDRHHRFHNRLEQLERLVRSDSHRAGGKVFH